MKKIIFVVMAIIYSCSTSFAQSKAPEAVTNAFNKKFQDATDVKWDKENAHEYEAEFTWKGAKYSANFNDKGDWLETEYPLTYNQLPAKVQSTFTSTHKGVMVKDVSKIEKANGEIKYEIELKQGVKTVELFYTPEGADTKE